MIDRKINFAKNVEVEEKYTANLDQALNVAGIGWYNLKYCLVIAMLLIASIMELLGYSLVLLAAICDLQMSDTERGLVTSIPYVGILLTSYPWGYLVDIRGRKRMLIYSSLAGGGFSMLSGLMPNLLSYAICKFLASLCLACPSATPYTYIGEILPPKHRDVLLSVFNATQIKKLIAPTNEREKGSFLTSLKVQTVPLLRWFYLKWILLNGFLLFGTCSILNGLNIWVPDVINRVFLEGAGHGRTACDVIVDKQNQTVIGDIQCNDTIDEIIFKINAIARLGCAVAALVASSTVQYIGKKSLIISSFWIIGTACTGINFITKDILFAIILSSTPIIVLAIGPINAYAVEIFPTQLRGMAVNLSMMLGRTGSIVGANVTSLMINSACESMFYLFGGLIIFCGALAFLYPNSNGSPSKHQEKNSGSSQS